MSIESICSVLHPWHLTRCRSFVSISALITTALLLGMGFASTQAATSPKAAVPTQSTPSSTFEIDDTHSMALFRVQHLGAGRFWGLIHDVSGAVQYVPETSISMTVSIKTESIDTNNAKLDRHLKSPDFFNAVEFPTMNFVSTSSKRMDDGRFEVSGDLTIRGVTKQVTVPFECSAISNIGGVTRAGFEATFNINRSEFGVTYGVEKKTLGDETRVIVSIEGVQTDPAGEEAKAANPR